MSSWEKNARKVTPYVPGEQPKATNIIKLNTNENPYPPSPAVLEALGSISSDSLRRYPDPNVTALVSELATTYKVKDSQVFVGVGSDDVLALCFMTFFNGEAPLLFPDVTYSFYPVWAELFGIPYEKVPLTEEFRIDAKGYEKPCGGIIFPNPNAPTSVYEELSLIEEMVKGHPDCVVIVDEAYIDFAGASAISLLSKYDNLLVVQTFSKSRSMAGSRIGYALGSERLISYLQDVKQSFNSYTMSVPSIVAGVKALQDKEYFAKRVRDIVETREWFCAEMKQLGFTFPEASGNFIFATHEKQKAKDIYEEARKQNIFLRYFPIERCDNYLRITIGLREEMEQLLSFLKKQL